MTEVAPGVHVMGSEMISWYVVEEGGRLTVVDAGVPGFAKSLDDDLAALGFTRDDVDAVVLTHGDADHTGLAPVLQRSGARVLVHEDDDHQLRHPGPKGGDASTFNFVRNAWRPSTLKISVHVLSRFGGKPAKVEGAETFTDGDALDVPGGIRVTHTPGHTPGHCVLLAPQQRVLFAGDQLCTHPVLTGDGRPTLMPRFFNIDDAASLQALDRVEPLEGQADVVCVGHGPPWRGGVSAALQAARESRS